MWKTRITALLILLVGVAIGYYVYVSEPDMRGNSHVPSFVQKISNKPFRLGLDLSGGTHLIYRADVSQVKETEVRDSMNSLRDVIERRVNLFGVSEPSVQVQNPGFTNVGEHRLIVDLPGVTDIEKAVAMIGQTPLLEFKVEKPEGAKPQATLNEKGELTVAAGSLDPYVSTQLTGRFLDNASLQFEQNTGAPTVVLKFNPEGAEIFKQLTHDNVGKTIAIYLDGSPISTPTVNEEISGGEAVISGVFSPQEARQLVGRLNSGALPVPIELISTQTIGASLGEEAIHDGAMAGIIGFLAIALFLIFWYRLPGIIAVLALLFYIAVVLFLFKLIPVTLTAAGIAGFIVSLGIAVDANVLIFERIKEEIKHGRTIADAVSTGFTRAWDSIRDSNFSTLITAVILFWFGTSLIKGFALTLGVGVIVSMLSAIIVSRIFLLSLGIRRNTAFTRFFFGSGISNAKGKVAEKSA